MEGIYSWIKTIVIFMIFLTILSNMLGKSDFKKYINVVTGLLLVLVTVNPILQFISQEESFDYYFDSVSFDLQTTEVANEMQDAEEAQRQVILANYKEEIRAQIESLLEERDLYLLSSEIVINEDSSSEDYAKIKELTVVCTYYVQEDKTVDKVDPIVIPDIEIGINAENKEEKTKEEEFLSPMEIQVKNTLSDFYNIKADNINISIQGG